MNPSTKILVTLVLALSLVLAGAGASFAAVWTGKSGADEPWRYRILADSIGPSTGGCGSDITVYTTLQTDSGTGGVSWVPAAEQELKFGFRTTGLAPATWFSSTTDSDGRARATIPVPAGAVQLWAQYKVSNNWIENSWIAFNTPGLTLVVSDATYDGKEHGGTATVTDSCGHSLYPPPSVFYSGQYPTAYPESLTAPTNAGNYAATASYIGSPYYFYTFKDFTIRKASSSTGVKVAGDASFTYDGNAHPATVAVIGIGGLNLTPAPVYSCGHAPVAVADSGCKASYTYAGDMNHESSSGSVTYAVAKAPSTTTVTASLATYDGNPHSGTAAATGVGGLNQSLSLTYSGRNATVYGPSETAPTAAGDYTAAASFAGGCQPPAQYGQQGLHHSQSECDDRCRRVDGHV